MIGIMGAFSLWFAHQIHGREGMTAGAKSPGGAQRGEQAERRELNAEAKPCNKPSHRSSSAFMAPPSSGLPGGQFLNAAKGLLVQRL
jgi:hypothetical protein